MLIIKKSLPILSIAYLTSLYALPQSIAAIPKFKSSAGLNFVFILIFKLNFYFERDIQHCTFLKIVKNIKKLSKLKISRC